VYVLRDKEDNVVAPSASATALRWWFAVEMRRMREAAGVTRDQAATAVVGSVANIGHVEVGRALPKPLELQKLLETYGVPERNDFFQDLRLRVKRGRDWWVGFRESVPDDWKLHLGLEVSAVQIESWNAHVIPGLFETRDTTDAIMRASHPDLDEQAITKRVELRMTRQVEVLDRNEPPLLWAVIAESALHWPVGGARVHRAQLAHLVELSERPTITIQILPFAAGAHLGNEGTFTILSAPPELRHIPGCVTVEDRIRMQYYDEPGQLMTYRNDLARLKIQALRPEESVAHLHQLAKEP